LLRLNSDRFARGLSASALSPVREWLWGPSWVYRLEALDEFLILRDTDFVWIALRFLFLIFVFEEIVLGSPTNYFFWN
jgi:hypothetical protein